MYIAPPIGEVVEQHAEQGGSESPESQCDWNEATGGEKNPDKSRPKHTVKAMNDARMSLQV